MSRDSRRWWLAPSLLNFDAPLVALAWQHLIAMAVQIRLDPATRAALGLAVWAIYLADRLLDTRNPASTDETARHGFMRQHRRAMQILFAIVTSIGVILTVNLPRRLVTNGLILGFAVLAYLALTHTTIKRYVPKQLFVSALFVSGVVLAPWTFAPSRSAGIAVLPFFLVCVLNTAAVEQFEWSRSIGSTPVHVSTRWIAKHYGLLCTAALIACAMGALSARSGEIRLPAAAAAIAIAGLMVLQVVKRRIPPETFPVLADTALFLSPLLLVAHGLR